MSRIDPNKLDSLKLLIVVPFLFLLVLTFATTALTESGLISRNKQTLFTIGFYELPADDAALQAMASAGVNLVRCRSKKDLDRVYAVGLLGWMPVNFASEDVNALRQQVQEVKDHPALAVWEGPDEIVHNFTAASALYRTKGVYKSPDAWRLQLPEAVEYSDEQAQQIIPRMSENIQLVRSLDQSNRQIWINEAANSDLKFVRQYLDFVDITGCDIYPVHENRRDIAAVGDAVERWKKVGRNQKPVWMVLQAFAWSELGDYYGEKTAAYPSFSESRFMAYDAIVHGAKGILYWGSHYLKSEAFRQSLYALTSELATLQPFWQVPEYSDAKLLNVQMRANPDDRGVKMSVRKVANDWLIILVNEDNKHYLGIEVSGLDEIEGITLELLYGTEKYTIRKGELVTRIKPFEVKLFATSRNWETSARMGRNFE